ncbi:MAG: HAD-IC family P-type ATPase [Oscillospiraceae bacterium]|nr:HAD-IC family P-type ATPase [Oscillospiraceae bacterium]
MTFIPVIAFNMGIGIAQELRSRSALRKMRFITATKATVIRDGAEVQVPPDKTVLDDVAVFTSGTQIYADAVILNGECRVNEALVTGEADEVEKKAGDALLSGSFIVAGTVRARLDKVGRDSFVASLTIEAKKTGRKIRSEMMYALNRLVRTIGVVIIPLGALMVFENLHILKSDIVSTVTTTTCAIIGMIPEGLYLLVSIALAVSVLRLAKKRTLVHEMRCIETLARVDTLCVDKTGTITEPTMDVREVVAVDGAPVPPDEVARIMRNYLAGADENETTLALQRHFAGDPDTRCDSRLPFSSANKYAGATIGGVGYLLGAPEKIIAQGLPICEKIENYSKEGYRVLLLARYGGDISGAINCAAAEPLALVLLTNKIRDSAVPTFKFFAEQGVEIRVISGDNPATVSRIAQDAGVADAGKYIDASTLKTERNIRKAAREYTVFGRVTPDMKRRLIRAMRAEGHTVAMTGDGVNDVLALKDADVGIAMASGSEVCSHVAQLVLVDSDFAAMTSVVTEGRRVINNIQRSSSLYLMKNSFSFIVAMLALILVEPFPLEPSQLTLFNMMFIGAPSFILALEPNRSRVTGRFMVNVMLNALPAGLTDFLCWLVINRIGEKLGYSADFTATMTSIAISFIGLLMLIRLSRPFNKLRIAMCVLMPVAYALGAVLLPFLFGTAALTVKAVLITAAVCAAAAPVYVGMAILSARLGKKLGLRERQRVHKANRRVKV